LLWSPFCPLSPSSCLDQDVPGRAVLGRDLDEKTLSVRFLAGCWSAGGGEVGTACEGRCSGELVEGGGKRGWCWWWCCCCWWWWWWW
jgi:hypothetical protein